MKVAKDLADWLPDNNQCWYANRVVAVKRKYGLAMDAKEAEVATQLLASCDSFALVRPQVTATPTGRATAAAGAVASTSTPSADGDNNALALYDDDGNGRISCTEARAHEIAPVRSDHPAYLHMRDPDGDGVVCE